MPDLTTVVASGGDAHQLLDYWTKGVGAAKIRWGQPNDFKRCVKHLTGKVADPKGLCAVYHHHALGVWPGQEGGGGSHGKSGRKGRAAAAFGPGNDYTNQFEVNMANLVTVPNVELMKTGKWDTSTGVFEVTPDLISAAIAAHQSSVLRKPVIRLGHNDSRFSGEPAVGYVDNVRASADGNTLLGDLVGVPQWLGDIMASAYPDRSIEGIYDYTAPDGSEHPFILTGLALLGVTAPGVKSLQSLQDVARLYDIAAAGQVGGTAIEIALTAQQVDAADPAAEKKGAIVASVPEEIARRLGIAPDADDETLRKALDEKLPELSEPAEAAPEGQGEPAAEPVAEPVAASEPTGEQIAAAAAKVGLSVIDTTVLASLQAKAEAGEAARAQQIREADDRTIAAALASGKITPASEKTWRAELAKNRDSVAVLLETMPENRALAMTEVGHSVAAEGVALDPEMERTLALITGNGRANGKDA
jgi:hypothetical protein